MLLAWKSIEIEVLKHCRIIAETRYRKVNFVFSKGIEKYTDRGIK